MWLFSFVTTFFYEDELLKTIGVPATGASQKPNDKQPPVRRLYCPICRQNAQPTRSERRQRGGSRR